MIFWTALGLRALRWIYRSTERAGVRALESELFGLAFLWALLAVVAMLVVSHV